MRIIFLSFILFLSVTTSNGQNIDSTDLFRMAKAMNAACPFSKGPNIRMDSARAIMPDTLLNFLTIIESKDAQKGIEQLRQSKTSFMQGLAKDRRMKYLMSQHIVLGYDFFYHKNRIISWVIGPEQFKKYAN